MSLYHQPMGGGALLRVYFHHVASLGQSTYVKQDCISVCLIGESQPPLSVDEFNVSHSAGGNTLSSLTVPQGLGTTRGNISKYLPTS